MYKEYNTQDIYKYVKVYPDFSKMTVIRVNIDDLVWFPNFKRRGYKNTYKKQNKYNKDVLNESIRRTRQTISDYVLCNQFTMFATFTFNGNAAMKEKYGYIVSDRTDTVQLKRKMSKWISNQKAIHGDFDYLIVPEFHKDGKSIHFHALLNGYNGNLKDTHRNVNSRRVYNIKSYKLGHSTVVKIPQTQQDYKKISDYLRKYIYKDMPLFAGKKRYWVSKGLKKPLKIINPKLTEQQIASFDKKFERGKYSVYVSDLTDYNN